LGHRGCAIFALNDSDIQWRGLGATSCIEMLAAVTQELRRDFDVTGGCMYPPRVNFGGDMIQGGLLGFWSILVPAVVTVLAVTTWRLVRRNRPGPAP